MQTTRQCSELDESKYLLFITTLIMRKKKKYVRNSWMTRWWVYEAGDPLVLGMDVVSSTGGRG